MNIVANSLLKNRVSKVQYVNLEAGAMDKLYMISNLFKAARLLKNKEYGEASKRIFSGLISMLEHSSKGGSSSKILKTLKTAQEQWSGAE
jgi:hypothetical protein